MNKNLLLGVIGTVVSVGGLKLYKRRVVKEVLKKVEEVLKEDADAYIKEKRERRSKQYRGYHSSRVVDERE